MSRKLSKMKNQMYTCVILHNMIIKDDGNAISPIHIRDPPTNPVVNLNAMLELRDEETHFKLRMDLVEHVMANVEIELSDED